MKRRGRAANTIRTKTEADEVMEYSVKDKARMMSKTKWGKSLSADDLANLAPYLEVKNFARGQAIFVQDEKGSNMAFILKGSVDVIKDVTDTRDTIVVQLGAGNNCGEFSFIDDLPRSASVLPREDTQVLLLEKKDFRELCREHPDTGLKFLELLGIHLSRRLRATTEELVYRI